MRYNVTGGKNGHWHISLEDGTVLELVQPALSVPEIERRVAAYQRQTEEGLQQRLKGLENAVAAFKSSP